MRLVPRIFKILHPLQVNRRPGIFGQDSLAVENGYVLYGLTPGLLWKSQMAASVF
jgi:hypothetical protein